MKHRLFALVIAALVGCGGTVTSPEDELAQRIADGWAFFEARDYTSAETEFVAAQRLGLSSSEAALGVGWCALQQDELAVARQSLVKVGTSDAVLYRDARAGLAVVYDATGQYDRAISAAQVVLGGDSQYVFLHDERVDWRDLRYILAKNYLVYSSVADADYTMTTASLNAIDTATPALNPADPATWTASGVVFGTFREAALKRLADLHSTIAD